MTKANPPSKYRKIKCRYCDFTVLAMWTTKDGRAKQGMVRMMHHVRDTHTPTYELQRIHEENDLDEITDYYE